MDNIHSMYHLANLNQDQKSNPNIPAVSRKIEAITKINPLKKWGMGQMIYDMKFHQIFKELTPLIFKLFHKIEPATDCPIFYKSTIILIHKNITKIITEQFS